ncbi:D(1)-like dopamine receptor [Thalassophryne amazonica]|uniref:D(1)-like dopamine receptor n=1 Tax=Thalassophryne amazonica TaxID=390379 RepID=UPI00147233B6|nr:D(1)-like dopamine receptor [Thalassophryne amazonica]
MRNSSALLSPVLPLTSFCSVLLLVFSITLASTIVFLNASVCLSILLNKALRNENRFMYMLSTCVSDLCTGVSYYYVGTLDVSEDLSSPTRTYFIVPTFLGLSLMAVLAAQADRYHAVASPFKYSRRMTLRRTLLVILSYWLYAFFVVAVFNVVGVGVARRMMSVGTFAANILTVIIMIGLNIRLFVIARFQLRRQRPAEATERSRSSVHLILVVAAFFLATWLPLFGYVMVCNFFYLHCYKFKNEGSDPFRILPRINAALTPLLYARGCAPLRVTLFTTVWRLCCRHRVNPEDRRSGPVKVSAS